MDKHTIQNSYGIFMVVICLCSRFLGHADLQTILPYFPERTKSQWMLYAKKTGTLSSQRFVNFLSALLSTRYKTEYTLRNMP